MSSIFKNLFSDESSPRVRIRPSSSYFVLVIKPTADAVGGVLLHGKSSTQYASPGWPVLPHFIEINGSLPEPVSIQLASETMEIARFMQSGSVQICHWTPTPGPRTPEESAKLAALCRELWGGRDIRAEALRDLSESQKRNLGRLAK